MKPKKVEIVPVEALEAWPTKRLMGRLNALRRLHESKAQSDYSAYEMSSTQEIVFKADPRWKSAYSDVKRVLETREHLPRGKAVRQARAKSRKR